MTQSKVSTFFSQDRIAVITLILNVLCIIYMTIIKDNTTYNRVQQQETEINEIKQNIRDLQNNKLDKEVYDKLYQQGSEMRLDIKDIRMLIMQHIDKDKR